MLSALDDPEYDWTDDEEDCPIASEYDDLMRAQEPARGGNRENSAEAAPTPLAAPRAHSRLDDPALEWPEGDDAIDDLGAQVIEATWGRPLTRRERRATRASCGEYCRTCQKSCVKFAGARPGLVFKLEPGFSWLCAKRQGIGASRPRHRLRRACTAT